MLRPLPPFRAEPLRKPLVPKPAAGAGRKDASDEISVKARRAPVRFVRPATAPTLKVLGRAADDTA